MASLSLKHIYKVYDGATKAVNDFNMEIRDKEFIVFVGPSGCGKSTTLRMIAGLEDISAGELRIDGVIVNDVEPGDRNIAMVFQNYALYPHMTVYENMAFSLRTAKVPREIIHEKVMEAARILGITEYLERKPRALSGGQRQRVSLGRAIVRHPKVFLLDEPLSNLDAKLRTAMRTEITRLHERLGTTFIYVTHDQVEAMTMGTRIVVMRGGFVQQIDTPKNLYNHPANQFVAEFIGTPRMNLWSATLAREGEAVRVRLACGVTLSVPYALLNRVQSRYMDGVTPVLLGVRPDDIRPDAEGRDSTRRATLVMTVTAVESPGGETLIHGYLGETPPADRPQGSPEGEAPEEGRVILKAAADYETRRGERLEVSVDLTKLHLFDAADGVSIKPRIPTENRCPCGIEGDCLTVFGQRFPLPPALCGREPVRKGETGGMLILPAEAVLLGTGTGRARVAEAEVTEADGTPLTLYRLAVGEETLFALEAAPPRFGVGDTVPFDPDFSRITVEAYGISPLPAENRLVGRFTKEKEMDTREGSPTRGKRVYRFYLEVEDQPLAADEALCEKLFSCKGTAIFRTPLAYVFPLRGAAVTRRTGNEPPADGGALLGQVVEMLDYGRALYARIRVGEQTLIAPYNGCRGDRVYVIPDQAGLSVVDREAEMIIV